MSGTTPAFDCIAERTLEYRETQDATSRKAIVRMGRPYFVPPSPGEEDFEWGTWVGAFEIVVEGKEVRFSRAFGADSIQALQLALVHIGLDLQHHYPGQFAQDGQPDLGFPTSIT